MKKFLIIISVIVGVIVGIYFVLTGILTVSGICPKYIDLTPRVVGPDFPKDKSVPVLKFIFCPFAEKVY